MTSPATSGITIVDARADDLRRVPEFYATVIVPSFPPDELESLDELTAGLRSGRSRVLMAVAADGALLGGAIGDWFPASHVMLLAYLAVLPATRGTGVGGQLLARAARAWTDELAPRLIVLEVEDPRDFAGSAAHGDPVARVRFYERHGVRALPLPYLQPALGPGTSRVPRLMLMVGGGTDAPPGTATVDGQHVAAFLREYFQEYEGPPRPDDPEFTLLLDVCARPGGLPLLLTADLPPFEDRRPTWAGR